ncbi:uncharacterized protein BDZ99DRAFT_485458 [Mytilinidion resinicola]|uniref:FAD-binding FR-type domain-containing protein n=1 Tax=Mytilinidion resinicola TaxID=574789 RepID=A0A6A6Z436_9PEZI|nr:uncharacterized protein BDZ99DRAFT_485458 [Mytilinidion resinicola]KAF2814925.1 hypothetical protein BDZ99DRAFT_485458 [Mytilinidion resinicola]
MAQTRSTTGYLSHEERTAAEVRDPDLHSVILDSIEPVNERIRLLKLRVKDQQRGIKFLPGQWLDVHVPGLKKAGGFTITSTPKTARSYPPESPIDGSRFPYLELAIQDSPSNPPAAWLWRAPDEILGKELEVRAGGSFVWPPPGVDLDQVKRVVFIAGGVGINPLVSILSHIRETNVQLDHRFIYATKISKQSLKASEILFLPRLLDIFKSSLTVDDDIQKERLDLFFTGHPGDMKFAKDIPHQTHFRRLSDRDIEEAAGTIQERQSSLFYVCGPPTMTDHVVDFLKKQDSVRPDHVLCEKWW